MSNSNIDSIHMCKIFESIDKKLERIAIALEAKQTKEDTKDKSLKDFDNVLDEVDKDLEEMEDE